MNTEIDKLINEKGENFKNFMKGIVEEKYIPQISGLPIDLSEQNLSYIKSFLVAGGNATFLSNAISYKFGVKNVSEVEKIKEYVECLLRLITAKLNLSE